MSTFLEICIYEVKPDKVDEFEILIEEVAEHHKSFVGVTDVKYIKRTLVHDKNLKLFVYCCK